MFRIARVALGAFLAASALTAFPPAALAADHGDAPNVAGDQSSDLADLYVFLDPADNTRLVLIGTFRGFIVPSEAVNFGIFDHTTNYHFEIENTGDAKTDQTIEVAFSPKGAAASEPQTASVAISGKPRRSFTAPTTASNLNAAPPDPTISNDPATGITFFAGEVDDPFFFDIPAFSRYTASLRAGSPNTALLNRGRDSFAGYNILCIAMSMPVSMVRGADTNDVVGATFLAVRRSRNYGKNGVIKAGGKGKVIDRISTPGVNVALVPFARKNEHNVVNTLGDSLGVFATDIVTTLQTFGANEQSINMLAGIAVSNGDYVRVNVTTANSGPGGGNNAGAGFPNGRRLGDDVIDFTLTAFSNGTTLGDNVNASDVPLRDAFPFVAPPQQPRDPGVIDDNTRN